jgi:xanthine/uracil permease
MSGIETHNFSISINYACNGQYKLVFNFSNLHVLLTKHTSFLLFQIQGGIIVASITQVVIGCTGILGVLLQYIGPITVVPTITVVGLSLIDVALSFCKIHWGVSFL